MKTCTVDGCTRRHSARGMCTTHYNREWRAANPGSWRREGKRGCDFPGCGLPHYCKGLCAAHYMQAKRGTELRPIGTPREQRTAIPRKRQKAAKSNLPPGWGKKVEPAKPRAAIDTAMAKEIPLVPPIPEPILTAAREALRLHGAEDLAEMLGVA